MPMFYIYVSAALRPLSKMLWLVGFFLNEPQDPSTIQKTEYKASYPNFERYEKDSGKGNASGGS